MVMTNVFRNLWVWHDTYMVMTNVLGICESDMTRIWSWQTFLGICEFDMTSKWSWQTFLGICESEMTRIWSWQTFLEFVSLTWHVYGHDKRLRNFWVWRDTYMVMTNILRNLWVWHGTNMVTTNVFRYLWVWRDTHMVMTNVLEICESDMTCICSWQMF